MRALVVAAAVCAAALTACRARERATPTPPPAPATATPEATLDALVQGHLVALLAASPTAATWLGVHGGDDRLDDLSATAWARETVRLLRTLERARAVDEKHLDEPHRLDRALLVRDLERRLFTRVELRPLERNPLLYVDVIASGLYEPLAHEYAPLPDRLRSVVSRLGHARAVLDEARRNLHNPPDVHARKALELLGSLRGFAGETLPRVVNAVADERLAADFRAAQGDALKALDDFSAWLARDLVPRAHGEAALGRDRLRELLRLDAGLEPGPDFPAPLLAAAERELKAAQRRFEDAAQKVAPGKTPMEAFRGLEDDHPAAEALLPTVGSLVDAQFAAAAGRLLAPRPAEARPRVAEMPPFLWGYLVASYAGPFEGHPSSLLYVDPVNPRWDRKTRDDHLRAMNRPQLALGVARDGLARFVAAEAARRAPTTMQRLSSAESFVEGWPGYLASLAAEEGADPKLRLAARRDALVGTCRLLAALRVHALGARLDDAERLFADACFLDEATARREAERVVYDPDVLAGPLGALALARLRDDAARARGDGFSLAAFNESLLAHGPLPVGELRRLALPGDRGPPL
jgi:hypothetical protein